MDRDAAIRQKGCPLDRNEQRTIETFVLRHANATPIDVALGDDFYDRLRQQRLGARDNLYFLALAEAEVRDLLSAETSAATLSTGARAKIDRLLQNARGAAVIFRREADRAATLS